MPLTFPALERFLYSFSPQPQAVFAQELSAAVSSCVMVRFPGNAQNIIGDNLQVIPETALDIRVCHFSGQPFHRNVIYF
jgi:hypothetical protein